MLNPNNTENVSCKIPPDENRNKMSEPTGTGSDYTNSQPYLLTGGYDNCNDLYGNMSNCTKTERFTIVITHRVTILQSGIREVKPEEDYKVSISNLFSDSTVASFTQNCEISHQSNITI